MAAADNSRPRGARSLPLESSSSLSRQMDTFESSRLLSSLFRVSDHTRQCLIDNALFRSQFITCDRDTLLCQDARHVDRLPHRLNVEGGGKGDEASEDGARTVQVHRVPRAAQAMAIYIGRGGKTGYSQFNTSLQKKCYFYNCLQMSSVGGFPPLLSQDGRTRDAIAGASKRRSGPSDRIGANFTPSAKELRVENMRFGRIKAAEERKKRRREESEKSL
jgi:hypothetical protein